MIANYMFSLFGVLLLPLSSCYVDKNAQIQETYAFVLKVYSENGKNYIDTDYIQYLIGDKAIEEAKNNGEADVFIVNGKKKYAIPGDYFILNQSKKIRKLELSKDIKFELVNNNDLLNPNEINTLEFFKKHFDGTYKLILEENKVIKIDEVFIP